jgi:hypothetical protein
MQRHTFDIQTIISTIRCAWHLRPSTAKYFAGKQDIPVYRELYEESGLTREKCNPITPYAPTSDASGFFVRDPGGVRDPDEYLYINGDRTITNHGNGWTSTV